MLSILPATENKKGIPKDWIIPNIYALAKNKQKS